MMENDQNQDQPKSPDPQDFVRQIVFKTDPAIYLRHKLTIDEDPQGVILVSAPEVPESKILGAIDFDWVFPHATPGQPQSPQEKGWHIDYEQMIDHYMLDQDMVPSEMRRWSKIYHGHVQPTRHKTMWDAIAELLHYRSVQRRMARYGVLLPSYMKEAVSALSRSLTIINELPAALVDEGWTPHQVGIYSETGQYYVIGESSCTGESAAIESVIKAVNALELPVLKAQAIRKGCMWQADIQIGEGEISPQDIAIRALGGILDSPTIKERRRLEQIKKALVGSGFEVTKLTSIAQRLGYHRREIRIRVRLPEELIGLNTYRLRSEIEDILGDVDIYPYVSPYVYEGNPHDPYEKVIEFVLAAFHPAVGEQSAKPTIQIESEVNPDQHLKTALSSIGAYDRIRYEKILAAMSKRFTVFFSSLFPYRKDHTVSHLSFTLTGKEGEFGEGKLLSTLRDENVDVLDTSLSTGDQWEGEVWIVSATIRNVDPLDKGLVYSADVGHIVSHRISESVEPRDILKPHMEPSFRVKIKQLGNDLTQQGYRKVTIDFKRTAKLSTRPGISRGILSIFHVLSDFEPGQIISDETAQNIANKNLRRTLRDLIDICQNIGIAIVTDAMESTHGYAVNGEAPRSPIVIIKVSIYVDVKDLKERDDYFMLHLGESEGWEEKAREEIDAGEFLTDFFVNRWRPIALPRTIPPRPGDVFWAVYKGFPEKDQWGTIKHNPRLALGAWHRYGHKFQAQTVAKFLNWVEFEYGFPQGEQIAEEWYDKALKRGLWNVWEESWRKKVSEAEELDPELFVRQALPGMRLKSTAYKIASKIRQEIRSGNHTGNVGARIQIAVPGYESEHWNQAFVILYVPEGVNARNFPEIIARVFDITPDAVSRLVTDRYPGLTPDDRRMAIKYELRVNAASWPYIDGHSMATAYLKIQESAGYLGEAEEEFDPAEFMRQAVPEVKLNAFAWEIANAIHAIGVDGVAVRINTDTAIVRSEEQVMVNVGIYMPEVAYYTVKEQLPLEHLIADTLGVDAANIEQKHADLYAHGDTSWVEIQYRVIANRKDIPPGGNYKNYEAYIKPVNEAEEEELEPKALFQQSAKQSQLGTKLAFYAMKDYLEQEGYVGEMTIDQTSESGYGNILMYRFEFRVTNPTFASIYTMSTNKEKVVNDLKDAYVATHGKPAFGPRVALVHFVPQSIASQLRYLPDPLSKGHWRVAFYAELGGYPIKHKDYYTLQIGPKHEKPVQI